MRVLDLMTRHNDGLYAAIYINDLQQNLGGYGRFFIGPHQVCAIDIGWPGANFSHLNARHPQA
jgi:hypothetical protein